MTVTEERAEEVAFLDRCHAIVQAANRSAVHVRSRDLSTTLCGRSCRVSTYHQPWSSEYVGCDVCRRLLLVIADREARGLPELCLTWSRPWGPRSRREMTLCLQPVGEGHKLRPDLSYDYPWHDGVIVRGEDDDGD